MTPGEAIAAAVSARLTAGRYIVAVSGSVAVGKTAAVSETLDALTAAAVDAISVCTDGFLLSNAQLDAQGLTTRKGFPDSYDVEALRATVGAIRSDDVVTVPQYSHVTYDVVGQTGVEPAHVTILDGLHLESFVGDLVDLVVHLDADHDVIAQWYVDRLLALFADAESDEHSFYRWAVSMSTDERLTMARWFWNEINLPNLVDHIDPARDCADLVVRLAGDHSVIDTTVSVRP